MEKNIIRKSKYVIFIFIFAFVIFFSSSVQAVAWVGNNVSYLSTEDTLYTHNLSANITSPAADMVFSVDTISTTTLWNGTAINYSQISSWIYITNTTAGTLLINASANNQTGNFSIPLKVTWNGGSQATTATFSFNVTPVNDAPQFSNLQNQSFNMSALFDYIITASDEEANVPFIFNISFVSCNTAQWSTRNSTNCTLFTPAQYSVNTTAINISFTPTRNDVGSYLINFSVKDLNNGLAPFNNSRSQIVNFTVLNLNSVPYFRYVCDNERNATENLAFICYVNATDIDETNNLTFISNVSWFLSTKSVAVNTTTFFNGSINASFTATDINVGNWSINLTVTDTGAPVQSNSSLFYFYVANVNDSVIIDSLSYLTAYTTNNYTTYLNATDNDLLIPDKIVYNESLTFFSNLSWVNVSSTQIISGTNKSQATINIFPSGISAGNYSVNLSVRDSGNFSVSSTTFIVVVLSNTIPAWNSSLATVYNLTENVNFYLNLTANASDPQGDALTFSYTNDTAFKSFSLNSTTGIINFTPNDFDIGQHLVTINVSDGITPIPLVFNFTVYNIGDTPVIREPLSADNATVDSNSNIAVSENNITSIYVFSTDDDFLIPSGQKLFYNETLFANVTIQGPNSTLLNFTRVSGYPISNLTLFQSTFIARQADVGSYNITVNISDSSGSSDTIVFNLTVSEVNNAPSIMNLTNQTSYVNGSWSYIINSSDVEDGNQNTRNLTYNLTFLSGSSFINLTNFNITSGLFNVTFNSSQAGRYRINVTVNDTDGGHDSDDFWIFVYNTPSILNPAATVNFTVAENTQSNLSSFSVNHTVGDNLNYSFYINGNLRNFSNYYGNATNYTWHFTPNFTEETHGVYVNLTLTIINPTYSHLNASRTWNINVTHVNAPVNFSGSIGNYQATTNEDVDINLSGYFSDPDYSDSYYNQTVNFTVANNLSGEITYSVSSTWILSLSSSTAVSGRFNITGTDLNISNNASLTSAISNNFVVTFTTPTESATASGGGGGGGCTPSWNVTLGVCIDGLQNVTYDDLSGCKPTEHQTLVCSNSLNLSTFRDRYVFTEQLITEQYPSCIEAKEMLQLAKEASERGDSQLADEYLTKTVDACKNALAQTAGNYPTGEENDSASSTFLYVVLAAVAALIIGIIYYSYKRYVMSKNIHSYLRKV